MIEFNRTLTINDALLRNILLRLSSIGKGTIEKLTFFYNKWSLFENLTAFDFYQDRDLKISDKAKKSLIDFMQCFSSYFTLTNDLSECQYREPGCDDEGCSGCTHFSANTPVENIMAICDHIIERDVFFEQFISEIQDTLNYSFDVIATLDNFLTDIESKKKQLDTENTQGVFVSTIHGIKGEDKYETVFFKADDFGKQKRDDVLKMSYVAVTRARKKLFIIGQDAYFNEELYDSFESLRAQVEDAKDESLDDKTDEDEVESIPIFINPITGNCLP
jgi:superfamily I DNA/RNA helicase